MFDIGWSEMAVILLVALIVIGPKDLPRVARTMGQWAAKGRGMAREFQRALEDMAREAELDKVKSEIEKAGRTNIGKTIEKSIDPSGELSKALDPTADRATPRSKPVSGDRPAGAQARSAPASSAPAAAAPPERPAPAGNGGAAQAAEETERATAAAAPVKRKPRARARNGAGTAEDTKEPARETAPAEPH